MLLALGSAITVGTADFLGGLASRRISPRTVVLGAQLSGLIALVAVLPLLPSATVDAADMAWGAAAGIGSAVGLTSLFRALARGTMSVVAPISAVVAGGVPVLAGVGLGERPSMMAWAGIAVALPAIVLIARERVDEVIGRMPRSVLVSAGLAGLGFGAFYVLVDRTGDAAGIQPLVAARMMSVALLAAVGLVTGRLAAVRGRALLLVAASGALDVSANVMFLYAVREGLLALGSVIGAMYPASTIVLARFVLGERLQRIQFVGLGLAGVAVGLVAAG